MPGFDGTGPAGGGPMTGGGRGYCGQGRGYGYGYGMGYGRGMGYGGGWGRGRGYGRGYAPGGAWGGPGYYPPAAPTPDQERQALSAEAQNLRQALSDIERRLAELEGQSE
ncbi:MAG: DUF5320 family protein [Deltaproteobacteria bacterium]|nr:DUF5320 family protein [Candidatus Anaeroferrophillacea bacterium]